MLKNLFKRLGLVRESVTQAETSSNSAAEALKREIEARDNVDPLIGAKMGSTEVLQYLIAGLKSDNRVHIESLLCAIGALAGYSCQASLRAQALEQGLPENAFFTLVETTDGKTYFFGDPLNRPLAESEHSVWGLAVGGAEKASCIVLPDIADMFRHASQTVGGKDFGIPRMAQQHQPSDTPANYLKSIWPATHLLAIRYCMRANDWPILYGLVAQEAIYMARDIVDPVLALTLVMESAIPMSKVDIGAL